MGKREPFWGRFQKHPGRIVALWENSRCSAGKWGSLGAGSYSHTSDGNGTRTASLRCVFLPLGKKYSVLRLPGKCSVPIPGRQQQTEHRLRLQRGSLGRLKSSSPFAKVSIRIIIKKKSQTCLAVHPLIRHAIWLLDLKDLRSGLLGRHVSHLLSSGILQFRNCPVENSPGPLSILPPTLDSASLP